MARRKGEAARARAERAGEPLGSISQPSGPGVPGTDACLRCGATDLTRIRMALTDGRQVVFVSCPSCEQRNWFPLDGSGIPLDRDEIVGGDA
ncbi:hypothetical protein [Cellulomonas sp. Root137]|uniref:hypothetical protein n=1 Tax=Cellulomonas sp. Root137 TaxID=1736459 RepID=UPI0006F40B53|nr:hypothetical protein [Cellulomonas sp. Root137]KQY47514.1 hypothetical protein ASD18_09385 [Cellulomonas sp. Root137]KRD45750.1 hypothetical protein ASE38_11250 [Cellulomonas sp. Root930]